MGQKIRKRLMKNVAKTYAASLINYSMQSGASSDLLNEDEFDYLVTELDKIARKISSDIFPDLDTCIIETLNKPS